MKILQKLKTSSSLIIIVFLFFIISITTLYSVQSSFSIFTIHLVYRQIIWYFCGFLLIYFVLKTNNQFFYNLIWPLYIFNNLLLLSLLLFAEPINNAKRWFSISFIGTFQPSEFMKIILIIFIAILLNNFNNQIKTPTLKEETYFLLKVFGIVAIPSFLTLLQPDTGVVIIYLVLTFTMLFVSGIRSRWFISLGIFLIATITAIITLFFVNVNLFIKILGTDFFLRVDRLLDWQSQTGFQLEHGKTAIGVGNLTGSGLGNTPIYFPEAQTDFIFAVFANNFGFIGIIGLFLLFAIFYYILIKIAISTNYQNQYLIAGFIGILFYQQVQNIGMTFGLLPLTGITLPFISAGGSSLISYMFLVALVINIANEKKG